MWVKTLIVVLIVCGALGYALWDQLRLPPSIHKPPVENVTFTALSGQNHALYDFKGRVVILHVWATWCPPCVEELPKLIRFAAQFPDTVTLVALSVDAQTSAITEFLSTQAGLTLPANTIIALDPDLRLSGTVFNVYQYPETLIIGPDMVLGYKIVGVADWDSAETKGMIRSLLPAAF